MNNLVGTLVTTDNAGKANLYLAESLDTSIDKRKWIFKLKSNLECESGEKITAESYARNLTDSLRRYSKRGRLLEFEKLVESEKLTESSTSMIKGIYAEGSKLVLEFKDRPEQLFERLVDPYFGYICDGNFEEDNYTWKNSLKIISSGPYKLKSVDSDVAIDLQMRSGNPLETSSPFKVVKFRIVESIDEVEGSAFVAQLNEKLPAEGSAVVVRGVPTFTVNLSLPIWEKSIFQKVEARRYFFSLLHQMKQENLYSDASTTPGNSFFPLDQKDYFDSFYDKNVIKPWVFEDKKQAIVSISTTLPAGHKRYLLGLLGKISDKMNFTLVEYDKTVHTPIVPENIKPFDIRVTAVDMDATPYFSLLDMIFCSQLGVRYSDYKGEICNFIRKNIDQHKGPLNQNQREELHSYIVRNGLLMPLAHRSITYMYSNNIDLSTVSGSAMYPKPGYLFKK